MIVERAVLLCFQTLPYEPMVKQHLTLGFVGRSSSENAVPPTVEEGYSRGQRLREPPESEGRGR